MLSFSRTTQYKDKKKKLKFSKKNHCFIDMVCTKGNSLKLDYLGSNNLNVPIM